MLCRLLRARLAEQEGETILVGGWIFGVWSRL